MYNIHKSYKNKTELKQKNINDAGFTDNTERNDKF